MAVTKATFGLPDDALNYIREQADTRGISMADVERQAITTDQTINQISKSGAKFLVQEVGESAPSKQLVFPR